jgi:preprotein translocase subunit YajC
MEGIYVFILVILFVIIVSMFFFAWQTKVGTTKNAKEMKTTLEKIQSSMYTQLSIITNFFKSLKSIFSR